MTDQDTPDLSAWQQQYIDRLESQLQDARDDADAQQAEIERLRAERDAVRRKCEDEIGRPAIAVTDFEDGRTDFAQAVLEILDKAEGQS